MSKQPINETNSTLPQLGGGMFLTDGGLETTLVFHDGWDLPHFEAFTLLESARGRANLQAYFDLYLPMAVEAGAGFILESPTWRANPEWGAKVGYSIERLEHANHAAIELMREIRDEYQTARTPIVISGCIGPRGDGYDPGALMSVEEATDYHRWQVGVFSRAGADCVTAITMTNIAEVIGIARAAKDMGIASVISFTVETNGRLPTGDTLGEAIEAVDRATGAAPAYYMINCAHPTHFAHTLDIDARWIGRLRGLRANASCKSHAELDNSTELDTGNPQELGTQYAALLRRLPHINVIGGCCGTDHTHIDAISQACRTCRAAA